MDDEVGRVVGDRVGQGLLGNPVACHLHRRRQRTEVVGPQDAVLEFQVEIDGISVNGVDIIKWNDEQRIVEFKVMIRPLKAINLIHQKMAAMLQEKQA
mgnify:CR=1 FL=1